MKSKFPIVTGLSWGKRLKSADRTKRKDRLFPARARRVPCGPTTTCLRLSSLSSPRNAFPHYFSLPFHLSTRDVTCHHAAVSGTLMPSLLCSPERIQTPPQLLHPLETASDLSYYLRQTILFHLAAHCCLRHAGTSAGAWLELKQAVRRRRHCCLQESCGAAGRYRHC
jgi:hypothetical protein